MASIHLELGQVTTLQLDNPPLNLVTTELTGELDAALATIESNANVRAVVVTGAGERAFSAGSDISEFPSLPGRVGEKKLIFENEVYGRLARLPMPTIAALRGDALGGGLELALCCDLRIAAETARLGMPEVRIGVLPGSGGTLRLPRLVGPARAKEMVFLGEIIDAKTALEMGLVNRVTALEQTLDLAMELGDILAERAPIALREAKKLIDFARDVSIDEGLDAQLEASERVFGSRDMLEGAAAFFEKRPPRFNGT